MEDPAPARAVPLRLRRGQALWSLATFGRPTIIVPLAFAIVYAVSQSFVYVEGDDASNIAFHALGRNAAVQAPYAAYHGMMDFALRILPPSEPVLRIVAFSWTSFAAMALVILMLFLAWDWLGIGSSRRRALASIAILLACPEFFYFGLVYTPSVVAMSFLLTAHLLLRRAIPHSGVIPRKPGLVLLSLILFGVGAACRWDTAAYGLVIVADIIFTKAHDPAPALGQPAPGITSSGSIARATFGVLWGVVALIAAFGAISLTGYGLQKLRAVYLLAGSITANPSSAFSPATFARFQTLFTPAFVLLGVIGFAVLLWRRRFGLVIAAGIGLVPVLRWMYTGIPKLILPAVPGLVTAAVCGFDLIWFAALSRRNLLVCRSLLSVLLVAPWIVGFRVYSPDTAWGPGFEIPQPASVVRLPTGNPAFSDNISAGRTVSVTHIGLTFRGGFAVPTMEGPRPLGGHASVLLGGGWRALVTQLDQEPRTVIERALAARLPILHDEGNSVTLVHLLQMGFWTTDPDEQFGSGDVARRFYTDRRGRRLTTYTLRDPSRLFERSQLDGLMSVSQEDTFLLFSGYSTTIRTLLEMAPHAVQPIGPFSAVVEIRELERVMVKTPSESSRLRPR